MEIRQLKGPALPEPFMDISREVCKSPMELYQLRTFAAVAKEKHLTRAAKRLNTSQPSVSAHIKALEQELGIALFQRSKKGMTLTDQGELMLAKAITVLDSSTDLLNQAEKIKGQPIGYPPDHQPL